MTTETSPTPADNEDEAIIYEGVPESPESAALGAWWQEQWLKSIDQMEATARELIALASALIGLLVGLMALTENPLPTYMKSLPLRGLMVVGVLCLLVALGCGLAVLWPRRWVDAPHRPDIQQANWQKLVQQKQVWLMGSGAAFGLGLFCLGAAVMVAVLIL